MNLVDLVFNIQTAPTRLATPVSALSPELREHIQGEILEGEVGVTCKSGATRFDTEAAAWEVALMLNEQDVADGDNETAYEVEKNWEGYALKTQAKNPDLAYIQISLQNETERYCEGAAERADFEIKAAKESGRF